MELILVDFDLVAHPWLDPLLESLEVNVAFFLRVQDIMHQTNDVIFTREDFALLQMLFKIFVRNKPVIVDIHLLKNFVEPGFRVKNFVLNLNQQLSQSLVVTVRTSLQATHCCAEFLIGLSRRWVRSYSRCQNC